MQPLYAIEYFVGRKYGGWILGADRFADARSGAKQMSRDAADEDRADATITLRRLVQVA